MHAKNPQTAKSKNPANDKIKNVQSTTIFKDNMDEIRM